MVTIKSYTDLEQSKKLAKILPLESADMYFDGFGRLPQGYAYTLISPNSFEYDYPCWSLAALLEQLPYELCDDDGYSTYLQINKDDDMYQLEYIDPSEILESIETDRYEHFVDACVAMVEKLNEHKML